MFNSNSTNQQDNNDDELIQDPSPKLTRQQIYDRIRKSSKDEYILNEMIRLGFWKKDQSKPSLTEQFIEKRANLLSRLRKLSQLDHLYSNPEQALKAMHKERKQAALDKREQTRLNRNQARYKKALAWYEKQKQEFTFLGEAVSAGLKNKEIDQAKLAAQNIAAFESIGAVAQSMGITVGELRFLCYQREVSTVSHYQDFTISKKSGGERLISAPMPRMKRAQYWLLDNILNHLPIHNAAHGFVSERSIVTNAQPHVGKKVVINLDLKDFFPTITYKRVKGLFKQMGYSEELAITFALIATKPQTQALEMDGKTWHVEQSERILPQGSPCSPAITNLLCRRLDARLQGMANKLGFTYTRYADDLTFSSGETDKVQSLLWRCQQIVSDEGFVLHPNKTRVMRQHQKQEVTGIVVNDGLSVDRKTLKRFRAVIRQIELDGPEGKRWGEGELFQSMTGYANFVAMVNPEKGIPLQKRLIVLKRQYNISVPQGKVTELNKRLFRLKAAKGESPRENWWQPEEKPAPVLELTQKQIEQQKKQERVSSIQPNSQDGELIQDSEGSGAKKPTAIQWLWIILLLPLILIRLLTKAPAKVQIGIGLFALLAYVLYLA